MVEQLITLLDLTLPFCLSPTLIVAVFNVGASNNPLDELPITASTFFNIEK